AREFLEHQVRFAQEMAHFLGRSTAQSEEIARRIISLYDTEDAPEDDGGRGPGAGGGEPGGRGAPAGAVGLGFETGGGSGRGPLGRGGAPGGGHGPVQGGGTGGPG
ncbi:MAG: hypothetical protein LBG06_11515, partial [Deltaproteobacteria bacterium]|nr:hypothetical protein [Deltaproteobacteria bacterium]